MQVFNIGLESSVEILYLISWNDFSVWVHVIEIKQWVLIIGQEYTIQLEFSSHLLKIKVIRN